MNTLASIAKFIGLLLLLITVLLVSGYLTMRLVIRGENAVTVPDLVGADVMRALEAAADNNLNVKVEGFEYSSQVAKNHVLYQEPAAGGSMKRGRDLRLVISRGPEALLGPYLVGLPLTQAGFILEQNDLSLGSVVHVHSGEARVGTVLDQVPPPHTSMRQGQQVSLLVSDGEAPREYLVPDVRAHNAVEAALALETAGLKQGQLTMACREGHVEGEVLEQRPRAGYKALAGAPVALVINESQEKMAAAGDFALFSFQVAPDLKKQEIRIDLEGAAGSRSLHFGVHDGGEIVRVSFPKGETGNVIVYQNGAEVLRKRY
ncbi:MAG: PASTA domain-containing protein [Pseudomonadota bacterium]